MPTLCWSEDGDPSNAVQLATDYEDNAAEEYMEQRWSGNFDCSSKVVVFTRPKWDEGAEPRRWVVNAEPTVRFWASEE